MQYALNLGEYQKKGYLLADSLSAFVFVKKTPPDVLKKLKEIDEQLFQDLGRHVITFFEF